jgi:hypothetical protein
VALLDSYLAQGGGRVWTVIPSSKDLVLNAAQAEQALRLQVGAMPAAWMYYVEGALTCHGCRKVDLKKVPGHFQHCASFRRELTTQRHDAVAIVLESAAQRNLVSTMWTPFLQGGKATDLAFAFWNGTLSVVVTIVAPDAPSKAKVARGSNDPARIAALAASAKVKKYSDLVSAEGSVFLPLAFNTSGSYTREVDWAIKRIAAAGEDHGVFDPVTPFTIRARLAVVIQRGNALININGAAHMRAKSPAWAQARATRRRRARRLARGVHGDPPA